MTEMNNMIFDLINPDGTMELDLREFSPITFKNEYSAADEDQKKVWNTGLAMVGDPHVDEIIAASAAGYDVTGALIPDLHDFVLKYKHVASIRLYRNNEYVFLKPGDSLVIVPKSTNEAIYYLRMPVSPILTVDRSGYVNKTYDLKVTYNDAQVAVTITKGGEEVDPGTGVLSNGDVITITATPESGYVVTSLKVNGEDFISGDDYTVDGKSVVIVVTSDSTE